MVTDKPNKILIINPIHHLREEIAAQLRLAGFNNLQEAGDGLSAIAALELQKFDAIISDIDIQNLDAWRLARLVRSGMLATAAETPFIVTSSTYSDRIAEATSKEFEIHRFIPFSKLELLGETVRDLIENNHSSFPRTRILVIEDYEDTAQLIERILSKRFDISYAADGEIGLQKWMDGQHDIVLVDLMLPKMSGEQVLREILKQKPDQSVVVMTAHGDARKAGELIIAGAVDFIAKPFKAEQLRRVCSIAGHREDFIISNQQFEEKQRALESTRNGAQTTLAAITDGVIATDRQGLVEYLNPVALRILDCDSQTIIGRPIKDVFHTFHEISRIPTANFAMRALAETSEIHSSSKSILRNHNQQELVIEQQAAPIINSSGNLEGAVLVFRDRTEAKQMERQLSFHASHDPLTGLHNREMFDQEVRLAMHEAMASDAEHALCHLDLVQFNMINDTCGHRAGDRLLQQVAGVLKNKVRAPSDAIARIGGDEFGILFRHCPMEAAQRVCEVISSELASQRFEHEEKMFDANVAIGIVPITKEMTDLGELVSAAGAACHKAKERGENRVACYSGKHEELLEKRTEVLLATELMDAIDKGRVQLYQQRIHNRDEAINDSFEILIRIVDEKGNILPPAPYLNAAERYNLTTKLDRWVIAESLDWLAAHTELYDQIHYLSINLSGLSMSDETFTDYIVQCFEDSGVSPEKICFEITETAAVSNFIQAAKFIGAIRDLGCKFALDDFGSGMSSFAYLKKFPVDILKIDGMFVKDILSDPIDLAMVKSINEVGHVMGLTTVAEYVESDAIADILERLGVDAYQGYAIAKPAPLAELLLDDTSTHKLAS